MDRSAEPSAGRAIDLNADLGEGFPNDWGLLELVSSASVCCGAHAGNQDAIRSTLAAAVTRGTLVGAHPGYPDREHFGRQPRVATAAEVEDLIVEQVESLCGLAQPLGAVIRFVKPHGALYNQAQVEPGIACGVLAAARRLGGLPVLGLPGGLVQREAEQAASEVRVIGEGFPDRGYRPDGTLIPRGEPGALLSDSEAIATQACALARRTEIGTLCLHGDAPEVIRHARHLRQALVAAGFTIRAFLDP